MQEWRKIVVLQKKQCQKLFFTRVLGGIEKMTLADSKEAIQMEVDKKVPFMLEQGGYIPMTDHSIPTNVSLENFSYFIDYLRSIK